MNKVASRSAIVIVLVLVLVVGLSFFAFEFVTQSDEWVTFSGSPHVYNGGNIGCGFVTDRNGVPLLDLSHGRIYSTDEQLRKATVHWLGDRKGSVNAPALSAYSAQLAGFDLLNGVYAYDDAGGTARLTLSSSVQTAALEALGDYKGTIAVYNYKTGELLCAVSTPVFDPDNVPNLTEDDPSLEGMYINRFVQSKYTPGSIFKIVTLAAALESIPDIMEQKFTCTGSYLIGNETITCDGRHRQQDLKHAFRNSCNCAFAQIAQQLGAETLSRYVKQFGITQSVSFDGITTAQGNFDISSAAQLNVAWSAIGQYTDLVNPCAFMNFVGAIANDGKGTMPHLVKDIASDGITSYRAQKQSGERLMSEKTAKQIQEFMAFNVSDKYGSDNFPGLTVCAKTGTAEVGGDKKPNAVFTGFVQDSEYPLAFIAVVEDGGYGREICVPMISKVLSACRNAMDKEQ